MRSFDRLIGLLSEIPDPRRREGKLYQLPYVLLFSILAVVTGGNSYRSIETFITVHRRRLNTAFGLLRWKRAPAPYRHYPLHPPGARSEGRRAGLLPAHEPPVCWGMMKSAPLATHHRARWKSAQAKSFDNFTDRKAVQLLHALDTKAGLVLRRISISTRSPTRSPPPSNWLAQLPGRAQHHHARCTALPKAPSRPPPQAQAHAIIQLKDNQPTLLQNAGNRLQHPLLPHQQRHLDHHRAQSP